MIELTDNTVGLWFVDLPDCDWFASVFMDGDTVRLKYRFRHYRDSKAFDSKDIKSWYTTEGDDVDELVEVTRRVATKLAIMVESDVYELMMSDFPNTDAFMEELRRAPFINARKETIQ